MQNPLAILYISYDGMTDNLGQSQVIPYLKGLSNIGYYIHILSFEKNNAFLKQQQIIRQLLAENKIQWHPQVYHATPPVVSTVRDIRNLLKQAKWLHKQYHFSIVHCRSYISAFAGLMMQRKFGVKFVFDMRGFWPNERVDGKVWPLNNPLYNCIYKYFKSQELKYLSNSNYIISLTNAGKNELQKWPGLPGLKTPVEVIPCCADFNHFSQNKVNYGLKEKIITDLGISNGDFILLYLGSVGTWYMLAEMLDFFKQLLKSKPNSKFLFVTGEPESMILDAAKAKGLNADRFIVRRAARNEVPTYIDLCHVSLFFIQPVFSKKASSPTKMAEIMGMGKPIICNDNVGDVGQIIEETKAGFAITDFTMEEYQKAINQIDVLLQLDSQMIRQAAIERFSLEIGVAKYAEVYRKLVS